MATDGAPSVESRKRALQEEMRQVLSKLREVPYFRLDDYLLSVSPPDTSPLAEAPRKGQRCKTEPLYVSRPVAPRLSQPRAKPIQTYNPG